jgi:hypothetical protein
MIINEKFLEAPQEVKKRYFQIKYAKYFMAAMRLYMRAKLTISENRKNKVLSQTLDTYRHELTRANYMENECVQVLMNIGLYYLIAEKDIQTVKIDALTHHNRWKRQLSLRIILLTIYEWDMGKASSKNLKELLVRSNVDESLQKELFGALRLLRKSQEKAEKLLRDDRNSIIAHRDGDALLQLKMIDNLRQDKVMGAAVDFYDSSKVYMDVFPRVLAQAGSLEGLFAFDLNSSR